MRKTECTAFVVRNEGTLRRLLLRRRSNVEREREETALHPYGKRQLRTCCSSCTRRSLIVRLLLHSASGTCYERTLYVAGLFMSQIFFGKNLRYNTGTIEKYDNLWMHDAITTTSIILIYYY